MSDRHDISVEVYPWNSVLHLCTTKIVRKYVPKKKLRNGPLIDVDPAIIKWRKERKHLWDVKLKRRPGKRALAEKELEAILKIRRG